MASWTTLRSAALMGSSVARTPLCPYGRSDLNGESGERFGPALAVPPDIHVQATVVSSGPMMDHGPGEILNGQEGGALRTYQQTEIRTVHMKVNRLVVGTRDGHVGRQPELVHQLAQKGLAHLTLLVERHVGVGAFPSAVLRGAGRTLPVGRGRVLGRGRIRAVGVGRCHYGRRDGLGSLLR